MNTASNKNVSFFIIILFSRVMFTKTHYFS